MANLVAIQFGILVGIVCCVVYSRFESAKPRAAAESQEQATKRAAAVEPRSDPKDRADLVDYRTDPDGAQSIAEQPVPVVENQYSPEAVERYRALTAQLYYQQIAPRRIPSTSAANSSIAAAAPTYREVAQASAPVQTEEPAPQPVAYVEPTQVIVYSQPAQFISYSCHRPVANRCRPAPHPGAVASNPHRRPDRKGTHWSGATKPHPPRSLGVVHRRNTGVPSCPPTQAFNSRGKP